MNEQELLEFLTKHQEAEELMRRGVDHFNKGNLEEVLLMFEESFEINPKSIPNLLYHSLCRFSLLQHENISDPVLIAHPKMQTHVQDIISKLETALHFMRGIRY